MECKCSVCKGIFDSSLLYEYRGEIHCEDCSATAHENADLKRQEAIEKQKHKTDRFRGLDLGDSQIGRANRAILKADIEIAKKV